MTRDYFQMIFKETTQELEIKSGGLIHTRERPLTSMTSPKTRKIYSSSKILKTYEDVHDIPTNTLFPEEQPRIKNKKRSFKIQLYNVENISRYHLEFFFKVSFFKKKNRECKEFQENIFLFFFFFFSKI